MDGGVADEVTAINAVNGMHLQIKEGQYSLKADSANMLESHEMIIPSEVECCNSSPPLFATTSEGKNFDKSGALEHPYASSRRVDATGVTVEELTLRNYDGRNLAIVGNSNNRDKMQSKQNQWQHLYQIAGGSGSGSSRGDAAFKEKGQAMPTVWEDIGYTNFPEFLGQKPVDDDKNELMENKSVLGNTLSPGGIRTKILSKSGFSEYFIKNTLRGKGVIFRGPPSEGSGVAFRGQADLKDVASAMVASDAPLSSSANTVVLPSHDVAGPGPGLCVNAFHNGVNLREWLKARRHKVNKVESLYIFRQIVHLVDFSHSHGVALQDLRPSCFKLLPSNQVIYLGSSVQKEMAENVSDWDIPHSENDRNEKRPLEQGMSTAPQWVKRQRVGENMNFIRWWPQFPSISGFKFAAANDTDVNVAGPQDSMNEFNEEHNLKTECRIRSNSSSPLVYNTSQLLLTSVSDPLEEKWYTSLEELSEGSCTFASNIYCLGFLLFELLGSFDSGRARAAAMLDLHYRILPPNFLSKNPKEAGLCLWLLYPEPSARPTARAGGRIGELNCCLQ
ncbi:hypothetical protein F0562_035483 [Nyssa sinensis]|uniref:Protein kinase domain-containing protein n=1 Tax=Nyssa sinensis TaxID=561372 RepID=A0A5J5AEV6_9ASTE|nr:hypothetical protein F0562_035483 [Nyssa sinensis]